jgi:hypothetical protein
MEPDGRVSVLQRDGEQHEASGKQSF